MGGAPARMVSDKSARLRVGEVKRHARRGSWRPARQLTGLRSEWVQMRMQHTRWTGQHDCAVSSSHRVDRLEQQTKGRRSQGLMR